MLLLTCNYLFLKILITPVEAGMPSPEWNKRQKQTLKVGHGGTLDSAAQGVLGKRREGSLMTLSFNTRNAS
jgi:hypothetical protein